MNAGRAGTAVASGEIGVVFGAVATAGAWEAAKAGATEETNLTAATAPPPIAEVYVGAAGDAAAALRSSR